MDDQISAPDSVQAKKDAAAEGATENYGAGMDGDELSAADIEAGSEQSPDPVTGRADHPTGAAQAAENVERDPVG